MGDPDALLPLIRSSFLFAVLEPGDRAGRRSKAGGTGKAAIAALEKAGLLVVFKGFDEAGIKDVLGGISKPAVVVGSGVPSAELAGLVKTSGTVYGLEFGAGEKPEDYAARLKAAVEAVGAGQLAIWNAGDLNGSRRQGGLPRAHLPAGQGALERGSVRPDQRVDQGRGFRTARRELHEPSFPDAEGLGIPLKTLLKMEPRASALARERVFS